MLGAAARDAACRVSDLGYVGHSLGGLVGLAHAVLRAGGLAQPAPSRLALLATSCWRFDKSTPAARRISMMTYLGTASAFGYAPIRRFGMGTDDEPLSYVRQLVGWAQEGRWLAARSELDYGAALAHVRDPILLLYGGGDALCTHEDTERWLRELSATTPRTLCVSRRTGMGFDPDHFGLVRSRRAQPAWCELVEFLVG
jgi:pimeloyl-ACP methyl ester carboxylesterase